MIHVLEEAPDIGFHHVVVTAILEFVRKLDHRLLRAATRPIAVTTVEQVLLVDRTQQLGTGQLHEFVLQRRDAERSLFPFSLGM